MTSATSADTALLPALIKLIATLEEENEVLAEQRFVSHAVFTDRKNQALRELMAAQRKESTTTSTEQRLLLQKLAAVLKENARLLKLHIAAVGEISDIIVGSLREAESDGTYSRRSGVSRG